MDLEARKYKFIQELFSIDKEDHDNFRARFKARKRRAS